MELLASFLDNCRYTQLGAGRRRSMQSTHLPVALIRRTLLIASSVCTHYKNASPRLVQKRAASLTTKPLNNLSTYMRVSGRLRVTFNRGV